LIDSYEPSRDNKSFVIYGILGVINGIKDRYVVVVSAVQLRGYINDNPIYAIDKVDCLDLDYYRAHRKLTNRAKGLQIDSDLENTDVDSDEASSSSDAPEVIIPTSPTAVAAESTPVLPRSPGNNLLNISRPTQQMARTNSFINRMKLTFGSKTVPASNVEVSKDENKYDGAVDTPAVEKAEPTMQDVEDDVRLDKRIIKEVQALFTGQTFFFSPNFGKAQYGS
jgi:hypothetical protein